MKLKTATLHAAVGGAAMRNRERYFEQVPIAVAETVLRQAAALRKELEKTPAPVLALERQATEGLLKQQESTPSKGQP
jgi:hypothetical protein